MHTSNIFGFARELACSRPVWIGRYLVGLSRRARRPCRSGFLALQPYCRRLSGPPRLSPPPSPRDPGRGKPEKQNYRQNDKTTSFRTSDCVVANSHCHRTFLCTTSNPMHDTHVLAFLVTHRCKFSGKLLELENGLLKENGIRGLWVRNKLRRKSVFSGNKAKYRALTVLRKFLNG